MTPTAPPKYNTVFSDKYNNYIYDNYDKAHILCDPNYFYENYNEKKFSIATSDSDCTVLVPTDHPPMTRHQIQ